MSQADSEHRQAGFVAEPTKLADDGCVFSRITRAVGQHQAVERQAADFLRRCIRRH